MPPAIDAAAFDGLDPAAPVLDLAGETMGTTWRVQVVAPGDAAELRAAIVARLDGLVAELSHWEPASLLSRYNRAPAGSWAKLPPDFAAVITAALDVAGRSDGALDPAIGRLVDLWGLGPPGRCSPPDATAIAEALRASGTTRLAYDGESARLRQPGGLALDLSGIAKGHAVDAVADLIAAHGHRHCLVEIGGELVGRGVQPSGEPWWVDLEAPPGLAAAPLRLALHGVAVATSGDYVRGSHTLDPRTGRPVDNGVVAVSVVAESAMLADAWATALLVLGPARGMELAAEEELAARIVSGRNRRFAEHLSPALEAMIAE